MNRFYNGYRLVKETSTLPISQRTSYRSYTYDISAIKITSKRYKIDPQSGTEQDESYSYLDLDSNGRLIGGMYPFGTLTGNEGNSDYTLTYDDNGLVVEYRESQYEVYDLSYENGLLDDISITDILGNTYIWSYSYDNESKIESIVGGVGSYKWSYTYNDANLPSAVIVTNQFEEQVESMEMEYDNHGNLNVLRSYGRLGNLVSVDTYEYEATTEQVFNHWLMRMEIEPLNAIGVSFVR